MTTPSGSIDPIALLQQDHAKVEQLFQEFEAASQYRSQARIAREAIFELEVHEGIEEVFYPALRAASEGSASDETNRETEAEHDAVHQQIAEVKALLAADDDQAPAKFSALIETMRRHSDDEEHEVFPQADQIDDERRAQLGVQMMARKMELQRELRAAMQSAA